MYTWFQSIHTVLDKYYMSHIFVLIQCTQNISVSVLGTIHA